MTTSSGEMNVSNSSVFIGAAGYEPTTLLPPKKREGLH
jgi:hypothetical protein